MSDTTVANGNIEGASVWEQALYDHVTDHMANEGKALQAYEALARSTDSPAFRFLADLILEDERRHHQLMRDVARSIRMSASMSSDPTPIPRLGMFQADRAAIRTASQHLLELERQDNRDLERLAHEMRDVRETTLWPLVVRILEADNNKHQMILEIIARLAKNT